VQTDVVSSTGSASVPPRVVLVGKPGCHLCDDARTVVEAVCRAESAAWREVSVLDDPGLADAYWEQIPVVIVDDDVVGFWRIDPERLRAALRR
jgi:hypothetical protein